MSDRVRNGGHYQLYISTYMYTYILGSLASNCLFQSVFSPLLPDF